MSQIITTEPCQDQWQFVVSGSEPENRFPWWVWLVVLVILLSGMFLMRPAVVPI